MLSPDHSRRFEEHDRFCCECGNPCFEGDSEGVWLHANADDGSGMDGYDLDADHVALPESALAAA